MNAEKYINEVVLVAKRVKKKYPRYDIGDLIGYGYIGLLDALTRYDGEGTAYLHRRVKGAMIDGIRQMEKRFSYAPKREYPRVSSLESEIPRTGGLTLKSSIASTSEEDMTERDDLFDYLSRGLSQENREIAKRRFLDEQNIRNIAKDMEIKESTIYSRLRKIRQHMREKNIDF